MQHLCLGCICGLLYNPVFLFIILLSEGKLNGHLKLFTRGSQNDDQVTMINQALWWDMNLFIDFCTSLLTLSIIKIVIIRALLLILWPGRRDIIKIVSSFFLLLLDWVSIIVLLEVSIFIHIVSFIPKYVVVSESIIVIIVFLLWRVSSLMQVISVMIVQELLLIPIGVKLVMTLHRVHVNIVRMIITFNHWICISCVPFKWRTNIAFIYND